MPTPFESAQLVLKLFELRREPTLREARNWWLREFHPETIDDVRKVLQSDRNASYRMVVGYWDMACSLVTHPRFENLILWFPLIAVAAQARTPGERHEVRQPSSSESR